MSNFVGKRPNPLAYAIQKISQKLSGQGKTTGQEVIKNINIAKNVDTKRAIQDKVVKTVDKAFKDADPQGIYKDRIESKQKKAQLKRDEGKKLKNISYKLDKLEERVKKAKGGRVGLKFGGRKSNVQKIQETFGVKKKLSPKQMKIAKLAGNPKKIDAQDLAKLRGRG